MRKHILFLAFLAIAACGGGDPSDIESGQAALERALNENTTWPYEVVGTLDIVEAGYADTETEYVEWAVGSLLIDDDEFGIQINIGDGVATRAGINIDSGEKVKVWLEAPTLAYGTASYPVSRIEKL